MKVLDTPRRLASIQTRRSLVPPPAERADPRWEESWRFLFQQYSSAMQRYVAALLARHLPDADNDEAAEVVQDYLAGCLEKGWLSRDAEQIRCFRAYVQVQLKRFTLDHVDYRLRKKRRPQGTEPFAPEELPADGPDPADVELDRSWVDTAVAGALRTLQERNQTYARIIQDLLDTGGEGSDDLMQQLGRPAKDLAYLKHRARARFATLFADELRATVRDDEVFEELLATLTPYLP